MFLSVRVTGSDLHFEKLILTAVFCKDDEKRREPRQAEQAGVLPVAITDSLL